MREIKFRAWDTIGKQWLRITGFETAETDVSKGYTIFGKGAGLFHDGDYVGSEGIILSQYTGLKDKNGQEIYEGDIVRCYGGAYWNGIYEYNYVTEVRDIRDLNEIVHSENVEILGNKYENPELLEVNGNE